MKKMPEAEKKRRIVPPLGTLAERKARLQSAIDQVAASALVLTPKGHATFDVEQDGKLLGSVWRYKDGWIPYRADARSGWWSLDLICDTFDDACEVLRREAGLTR